MSSVLVSKYKVSAGFKNSNLTLLWLEFKISIVTEMYGRRPANKFASTYDRHKKLAT